MSIGRDGAAINTYYGDIKDGMPCICSFPGSYQEEWNRLTAKHSSACVFFPDGDTLSGRHCGPAPSAGQPCTVCQTLYGVEVVPWGCAWFAFWALNVIIACHKNVPLVVVCTEAYEPLGGAHDYLGGQCWTALSGDMKLEGADLKGGLRCMSESPLGRSQYCEVAWIAKSNLWSRTKLINVKEWKTWAERLENWDPADGHFESTPVGPGSIVEMYKEISEGLMKPLLEHNPELKDRVEGVMEDLAKRYNLQ